MRINLGDDEQPEIGLIALIDCIFFLLMFFMVATSFKHQIGEKKEKTLPISLPTASASLEEKTAELAPIIIAIDKAGAIYWLSEKVSVQSLQEKLKAEFLINSSRRVRIEGDGQAQYQSIVQVLDLCQFQGFTNISMRTRN